MQPSSDVSDTSATVSALSRLADFGQSVWFDYIQRSLIDGGELARMVKEDGLAGVTSNPAIFEKAIAGSRDYDGELSRAANVAAVDAKAVYEAIAVADVRSACDVLRTVYERTLRRDGYVSLEVSPYLAHDTEGTLVEARRLWQAVDRENLMIKVPATPAGIPAIKTLISEGLNVNVTLLFALEPYLRVAEAFVAGLEEFQAKGGPIARVASVASFFVSRVDSLLDPRLEALAKSAGSGASGALAGSLVGRTAIANAKVAYKAYEKMLNGPRWEALARAGAMTQRLLWASTGTKNPAFSDVLYVEELIGPDTVNTIPPATYAAFKDHGAARASLTEKVEDAEETLKLLARTGISLQAATNELLNQGLELFAEAFDKLLATVGERLEALAGSKAFKVSWSDGLASSVRAAQKTWATEDKVRRLWEKDSTVWTGGDESKWLGWLDNVGREQERLPSYQAFAKEVNARGFTHVLLCGMGGSSLCPDVLATTFGKQAGYPRLSVIDSTDPQQVAAALDACDLARTLVIVSSKSGSTLEPNILHRYAFARVESALGKGQAGAHFVAVTDPGSQLERVAKEDGFWRVFHGLPSIGGRYSALSAFGLVPAAAMGLDVGLLLDRAQQMVRLCGATTTPERNPGVALGLVLGQAARAGSDKLTLVASKSLTRLGAWLEQLIAESTGKNGKAIIPVDGETLGSSALYGRDRVFAYLRLSGERDTGLESKLTALRRAGHTVIQIELKDLFDMAAEFFRWEIATAVMGEQLGIHPFDQPDVEASKIETRKLTTAFEQSGSLPPETPIWTGSGVKLFADLRNASELASLVKPKSSLADWLRAHLSRAKAGDYVALLAYVDMNSANESLLQTARHRIRDAKSVATCLGFGPRFLHSTGQAYKGGPNTGVFLQVTCDDARDAAVPGAKYSFGVVKAAQARGDLAVLAERGRRALRVHLGADVTGGLAVLRDAIHQACS